MKNNLLITTALVAVTFAASNAWAEDTATHKVTKEGELTVSGTLDGLHAGDKTDAQGGAVYHEHNLGELTVKSGTTFSNNYAQQTGGAISAYSDLKIEDNVTFSNNKSFLSTEEGKKFSDNNGSTKTEMGGAIYMEGTGTSGNRKLTIGNNVKFEGNEAGEGILYLYNGVTATIGNNVSFINNVAGHSNATQKAIGTGALTLVGGNNDVTVGNNALFSGNKAIHGGAVNVNTSGDKLKFTGTSTFTNNTADQKGGAILNRGALDFQKDALFSYNEAKELNGGAIYNHGGQVTIENATFDHNTAKYGGGAIFSNSGNTGSGGSLTIKSGSFTNNTSINGYGGAIHIGANSDVTIGTAETSVLFEGNSAGIDGGAISIDSKNATITNTTFRNNSAKHNGGAMHIDGSDTTNEKVTFAGNVVFENNTVNGEKNDIYFEHDGGSITVADKASLTLDGGISCVNGSSCSQAELKLGKGSNLNVNSQTEIESKVTTDNSDKANLNVKMVAGDDSFDLKDIFRNSSAGGESIKDKLKVSEGNNLYNIEQVGESTEYVAKEKSASEVASNLGVNGSEAETVLSMMRSEANTEAFAKVQDVLGSMAQDEKVDSEVLSRAADAMVADAAPTVRVRETALSNMIFDTATDAMDDSLQNAAVGQASGDNLFDKAKVWVKGLFNYADKDDTNKSHGFDIDTYGVAFGMDKNVSPSVKLGAGYAYSQSDIDGYTRDTDVDTHTLFAYAKYKPANWYVNTVASYSFSDYKEKKSVLSYSADAKYDVDTFGLQSVYGYELNTNGYDITPEAGLRYLHIAKDGYVDELGTMAVSKNTNVLTAIAGVKAAKTFELSNGMNIRPEVRAAVTYDLTSNNNDTNVVLPNGEALKVAGEKFDRFGAEFGAKLATDVTANWEVSAGYEGRFRDDYSDHTGILSAKYKF